jgi:hypothetical protein
LIFIYQLPASFAFISGVQSFCFPQPATIAFSQRLPPKIFPLYTAHCSLAAFLRGGRKMLTLRQFLGKLLTMMFVVTAAQLLKTTAGGKPPESIREKARRFVCRAKNYSSEVERCLRESLSF